MSTSHDRTSATILVVHYFGDGQEPALTKKELFRRGNPYNYDYPEYDFGIIADGTIIPMRPLTIRGAHCISDIPSMVHSDEQWWNKNSVSIVIGVGEGYVATDAQLKSLSRFITEWKRKPNSIIYRHCDITKTDCPNLSYEIWNKVLKGYEDVLKVAVLLFSKEDYWAGTDVAVRNGNCGLFIRPADHSVPVDAMNAQRLIVVGGPSVGHPDEILLTGNTKYDTAQAVAKYLG
jgi:hypothetical protein